MSGAGHERGGDVSTGAAGALVVVHPTADILAVLTAARLLAALADAQAARGTASVVLTGGGIGTRVLAEVAASPARSAVDWARVDVWWGDERFVPRDDPERNELQATEALLSVVDVDPARVHAVPAAGEVATVEDAAAAYAAVFGPADPPDVLLLGVGPEGHVGSIFPDSPAVREGERLVVGVHGCPKPPPVRVTLTLPAMARAREAWLVVSGGDKAAAMAAAAGGATPQAVPVAGVRATHRTLWLLDLAAAAQLP